MYSDGDNDVISRDFPSLEEGHLDQASIWLAWPKVKCNIRGCYEVVETGVVLQPLRGHHLVVQHWVCGWTGSHLWRMRGDLF